MKPFPHRTVSQDYCRNFGYPSIVQALCFTLLILTLFGFVTNTLAADNEQLSLCAQEQLLANSTQGSRKRGIVEYQGNVQFCNNELALSADSLVLQQSHGNQHFLASGSPVYLLQANDHFHLQSNAKQLSFIGGQQKLVLEHQVSLKLTQNQASNLILKANKIEYDYRNQQQLEPNSIQAIGTPVTIEMRSSGSDDILATAQKLSYQYQNGMLILEGEVEFHQSGDVIRASKILYNTQTREWQAPQVGDQRIEVILQP
jgi:lipopolysaccharide transport protein LptA